jgi:hypothetical protein
LPALDAWAGKMPTPQKYWDFIKPQIPY